MKGRASTTINNTPIAKWSEIQYTMKSQSIAILALQETHLDTPHLSQIDALYARRLRVFNTSDPNHPGGAAGTALVLNRALIDTSTCRATTLIPGRALALTLKWHGDENITMISIYAPNDASLHQEFWTNVTDACTMHNIPKPDFVLGDFNLVEDAIDRAPTHTDATPATDTLRDARIRLGIQDTWRHTYPDTKLFTYTSNHNHHFAQSRLDRIYTARPIENNLFEWNCRDTSVPTDHRLVSVRYTVQDAPYIGKGCWTLPLHILNNKDLLRRINEEGIALTARMESAMTNRTPNNNPQREWEAYKNRIREIAKPLARTENGKIR
ncbi:DNase I-like protein, partial [Dentipellis sp. KUC8613]